MGYSSTGRALDGIQEVSGSIPLISTNKPQSQRALWFVNYRRKMRNQIPGRNGPKCTPKYGWWQGHRRKERILGPGTEIAEAVMDCSSTTV